MSEELRLSPIETRGVAGKRRFAMVVDVRRCIGCMACQVACKAEYDTPLGVNRTWVPYKVVGTYPTVKKHFLPRLCNHCDDPPCVRACPRWMRPTRSRTAALSFSATSAASAARPAWPPAPQRPTFMLPAHRTYTAITNVVDKCTFCFHRVTQGLVPACVQTCIGRSRIFGDLNDPASEVSYLVATHATQVLRPEEGTKPHIFYIGADRNLTEHGRNLYNRPKVLDEDQRAFNKHFGT